MFVLTDLVGGNTAPRAKAWCCTGAPMAAWPCSPGVSSLHAPNPPPRRRSTSRDHIRTVPDWPAPGVQFRDITPLLSNPRVFRVLIDQFVHRYFDVRPDRGRRAGRARLHHRLGAGLRTERGLRADPQEGQAALHHGRGNLRAGIRLGHGRDAHRRRAPGDRVVLIDDLIATGGTMMAGKRLLERLGAR
jgi:adenine phosphoribosyltransferase